LKLNDDDDDDDDLTVVRLVAAAAEDVSFCRLELLVGDAVSAIVVAMGAMRTTEVLLAVLAAYRVLTNITRRSVVSIRKTRILHRKYRILVNTCT